eukprot:89499_1
MITLLSLSTPNIHSSTINHIKQFTEYFIIANHIHYQIFQHACNITDESVYMFTYCNQCKKMDHLFMYINTYILAKQYDNYKRICYIVSATVYHSTQFITHI